MSSENLDDVFIEKFIKDCLGRFLRSVDTSGDDIEVVLCNDEGQLYTPRMEFKKRKIKNIDDLSAKIRTIKSHASITVGFNAPISWEGGRSTQ